jgi:hypothetical protein
MHLRSRQLTTQLLTACLAILCLTIPALAAGPQTTVLYAFQGPYAPNGQDGEAPQALIADEAGNLYGVTAGGGTCLLAHYETYPCGIAFELSPPSSGGEAWTETVLYEFGSSPYDGPNPLGNLIRDKAGNLYGVTAYYSEGTGTDCGIFYELSPPSQGGGSWTETNLYSFGGYADGCGPLGTLVQDSHGNIYGVTVYGGYPAGGAPPKGYGTGGIFKLTPPSTPGEPWTEGFSGNIYPDFNQNGGIGIDGSNNLYMTLGPSVYEVFPPATPQGLWSWNVVYSFQRGRDVASPLGLTVDSQGNIYGVTPTGGTANKGTVYELSRSGNGWTESTLYSFQGGSDGYEPMAPPTLDKAGNVYGTTYGGGGNISNCLAELEGCGTVFKLTKSGNGWTERVLHTFEGTDGAELNSPVLLVGHTIYGPTTAEGPEEGSQYSFGTVFQIN